MKKPRPLTDLEMFELLQIAYPEKFTDESDDSWDEAMDFAECISGFDNLADLLGRVVMMAMPMTSPLTGEAHHVLGKINISGGEVFMMAAVKRPMESQK